MYRLSIKVAAINATSDGHHVFLGYSLYARLVFNDVWQLRVVVAFNE